MPALVFDGLLALGLVVLAWQSVGGAHLFRGVVLFIAFGLLMALAWLRLGVPDIAMAEAAVGAGLTGVLLLNTLGRIGTEDVDADDSRPTDSLRPVVFAGCLMLGGLVAWGVAARQWVPGLGMQVRERLAESGVENPVTAVLLNFRGMDTLLELGVLVLAVAAAAALTRAGTPAEDADAWRAPPSPLLDWFIPRVVPVAVLVGAYLWWAGAKLPGGAFQGGTVGAAAGVMLLLAERPPGALAGARLRLLLVLGVAVFLAAGVLGQALGGALLEYPADWAYGAIVAIETVLTVSIAACLFALVRAGNGFDPARDAPGGDGR